MFSPFVGDVQLTRGLCTPTVNSFSSRKSGSNLNTIDRSARKERQEIADRTPAHFVSSGCVTEETRQCVVPKADRSTLTVGRAGRRRTVAREAPCSTSAKLLVGSGCELPVASDFLPDHDTVLALAGFDGLFASNLRSESVDTIPFRIETIRPTFVQTHLSDRQLEGVLLQPGQPGLAELREQVALLVTLLYPPKACALQPTPHNSAAHGDLGGTSLERMSDTSGRRLLNTEVHGPIVHRPRQTSYVASIVGRIPL